jgi:hypothetical protein
MKKFTRWQTYLAGFSLGAMALLASCADGADRNGIFEPEVAPPLAVSLASVTPEVFGNVPGNSAAECSAVGLAKYGDADYFEFSCKIDGWDASIDGAYDCPLEEGDVGDNTITISDNDGTSFDWAALYSIGAVFVKGGSSANVFQYDPQAYSDTDLYAPTNPSGGSAGVSHVTFCWNAPQDYEELTVSKTAVTSYTRTHNWDIDKSVDTENGYEHDGFPKVWLYIDGSGDEKAIWTVDVTYEGYEDSGWNVSGTITIENTGTLDAVITSVADTLADTSITVDCGVEFPYTLPVGETLTCTYSEDGYVEGSNEVTVTTERDTYSASAAIVWGAPTTEVNETVNIKDLSDLFGEVDLGTVTAPNGDTFTYDKDFAWEDYGADGCGDFVYDNTATIVETGQEADATLLVNVQCYVYETAYAWDDVSDPEGICFIPTFSQWGWTNPIEPGTYEMDLWAGAAQCDTDKGELVGSVTVVYGPDGYVTVAFNVGAPYSLDETHVYAGTTEFPQVTQGRNRLVSTVAPGQYYNDSPFDGSQVYVIAHAVVGLPDPNFGPQD